ncbi:MAG: hypothetical protein ACXADY_03190 [Candidatus Hodarchaeales archaeon]|jgi:hypothetical protein
MKRSLSLLSLFILLIILLGRVDADQLGVTTVDNSIEPYFTLNEYVLQPIQTGVYHFYVEAQNNGSANATTGTTSFELRVNASINAIKFKINDFPIEANFSEISEEIGGLITPKTRIYRVPNNERKINVGETVSFFCTLISHNTTNINIELLLNWTDGTRTNYWKLVEQAEAVKNVEQPFFEILSSILTDTENYTKQFSTTIKNHGASATKENIFMTWEELNYVLPLTEGQGTLNESVVNLDLNGDGDEVDTFEVTWFKNQTRQIDATIDEVHVYALIETLEEEYTTLTYYINDKSKLFKLGNNYHALYECTEDYVDLGLNSKIVPHPTPNFQFMIDSFNLTAIQYVNVSNFRINGKSTSLNSTVTLRTNYQDAWPYPPFDITSYIIPSNIITSGEEVTFSCTLSATQNITIDIWFWVNWTPDGNIRYRTPPFIEMPVLSEIDLIGFLPPKSGVPSNGFPGYSFTLLIAFSFTLLIAFLFICIYFTRKK